MLVDPPLTMLCTLLYFTLRYLTSPGVAADEGAIDIIHAFVKNLCWSVTKCFRISILDLHTNRLAIPVGG